MHFEQALLGHRPQRGARQRGRVGAEPGREGGRAHPSVLSQKVEQLNPQRRGHGTDSGLQAPPQDVGVEADRRDVRDALGSWDLPDDEVRAAARHEPADLAGDQLGHFGLPPERGGSSLAADLAVEDKAQLAGRLRQRPGDVCGHREDHLEPLVRRRAELFLFRPFRTAGAKCPGYAMQVRQAT